jgi:hypothetical protein
MLCWLPGWKGSSNSNRCKTEMKFSFQLQWDKELVSAPFLWVILHVTVYRSESCVTNIVLSTADSTSQEWLLHHMLLLWSRDVLMLVCWLSLMYAHIFCIWTFLDIIMCVLQLFTNQYTTIAWYYAISLFLLCGGNSYFYVPKFASMHFICMNVWSTYTFFPR